MASSDPLENPRFVEFLLQDVYQGWNYWNAKGKTTQVKGLGEVTVVDLDTRHEFENPYNAVYTVVAVVTPDRVTRYFRKNGTSNSYGVTEWDGQFYEVLPETKTLTVYNRKA